MAGLDDVLTAFASGWPGMGWDELDEVALATMRQA